MSIHLADGSIEIPLKEKYRMRKTKGRYQGGPKAAPLRKRTKKGPKTYTYGSHVMVMSGTGKKTMVKVA